MLFEIRSYLNFLKNSQNQHGLHSPFMYDLVTKCFYDRSDHSGYELIKTYRNDLLRNKELIEIKDFGAGSKVFKSNKRPVFAIAKNAGMTLHRAKLLHRLVNYLKVENALELGTSLGIASAAISANPATQLTTIEGCPATAEIAQRQFEKYQLKVDLKIADFKTVFHEIPFQQQKFDLIFIDGNHQQEATIQYFETLLNHIHEDSVLIFDDIHWSVGMENAWAQIKQHPASLQTIDTFKWGMVFFRKQQAQQDFVIRV